MNILASIKYFHYRNTSWKHLLKPDTYKNVITKFIRRFLKDFRQVQKTGSTSFLATQSIKYSFMDEGSIYATVGIHSVYSGGSRLMYFSGRVWIIRLRSFMKVEQTTLDF